MSSRTDPVPASALPVSPVMAVDPGRLSETCRRWMIAELDVFGSVARGENGPDSDVDLLVTFLPGAAWGLLDHVAMEDDLSALFGRRVDLVTRRAVERSGNALRRGEILASARPIYVS
ncbi:MAG: nucleotidyltransferase family protein [Thermoanaerobaculia bacterium]